MSFTAARSALFAMARALFSDADARVGAHEIYELWSAPPFGADAARKAMLAVLQG